jgi:hypothetical protein
MLFEECRMRALECLRSAHEAKNECARGEWINSAQQWLQRAVTAQGALTNNAPDLPKR